MSLSSTSGSLNSSGSTPFNSSSSSINSTPPVDRYAALKDLDEQLREVVKDPGVFGSPTASATTNGYSTLSSSPSPPTPNGHVANPFKLAQAAVGNPFQQASAQPALTNGWATDFGSAPFGQQQSMFGPAPVTNGFSNGFHQNGFGQTQRNPFAVSVILNKCL